MTTSSQLSSLPVMEQFYTLQGEGFHQGKAAYFIRLGGCDVGCVWCDVKESWDVNAHPRLTVSSLADAVKSSTPDRYQGIVVITGGEPLMHPLNDLTSALHDQGFQAHLETSGAHPLSGRWDWICLSPKKFKSPLPGIHALANELKVVIFHPSDFEWAEKHAALVQPNCKLYLQPEWDKTDKMTPLIVKYIQQNPKWQLSLQIHKYIGVE